MENHMKLQARSPAQTAYPAAISRLRLQAQLTYSYSSQRLFEAPPLHSVLLDRPPLEGSMKILETSVQLHLAREFKDFWNLPFIFIRRPQWLTFVVFRARHAQYMRLNSTYEAKFPHGMFCSAYTFVFTALKFMKITSYILRQNAILISGTNLNLPEAACLTAVLHRGFLARNVARVYSDGVSQRRRRRRRRMEHTPGNTQHY